MFQSHTSKIANETAADSTLPTTSNKDVSGNEKKTSTDTNTIQTPPISSPPAPSSSPTSSSSSMEKSKLVNNILHLSLPYLADPGLVRVASATAIATLLSRPDMNTQLIGSFIDYCYHIIAYQWLRLDSVSVNGHNSDPSSLTSSSPLLYTSTSSNNSNSNSSTITFQVIGVLYTLCQLFKRADRWKVLHISTNLLTLLLSIPTTAMLYQTSIRKLVTKLVGKIALVLLPPKDASWRYARGKRSLNDNLAKLSCVPTASTTLNHTTTATPPATHESTSNTNSHTITYTLDTSAHIVAGAVADNKVEKEVAEDEEDEIEYIDEIEEIIHILLTNLIDKDTIVRWSAAKNLGRVVMRLPEIHARDVIECILTLFDDEVEDDATWHGGCLALAELARRHLISPVYLPDQLLPILKQAMVFDVVQGYNSLGSNVRDAACYLCWSFGHSYDPAMLRPYIHQVRVYISLYGVLMYILCVH